MGEGVVVVVGRRRGEGGIGAFADDIEEGEQEQGIGGGSYSSDSVRSKTKGRQASKATVARLATAVFVALHTSTHGVAAVAAAAPHRRSY